MLCTHLMHFIVKKTLEIIVKQNNDYVVKVKANQPNLLKAAIGISENQCVSQVLDFQRKRGRKEIRITKVFHSDNSIPEGWANVNRIITIERFFHSKRGSHQTLSYYISSLLSDDAKLFAAGIRGHWFIENKLHWVKDVILKEDTSKHKSGSAAKNMSIFRNITLNIFRKNGYHSTKYGTLFFASNVKELMKILIRT